MKRAVLVTLADEKYLKQAKQLFASAYLNGAWQGDYLLLANEIQDKKLHWFKKKGIKIYHCSPLVKRALGSHHVSTTSKCHIFDCYFKRWNQVVFLDADMIVNSSLGNLLKIKKLGAVRGNTQRTIRSKLKFRDNPLYIKLEESKILEKKALNAGLLVVNTSLITKNTLPGIKETLKKYSSISSSDEETALNIYFVDKWEELSSWYNCNPSLVSQKTGIPVQKIRAGIYHFIQGKNQKPWSIKSPFYNVWRRNLKNADSINFLLPRKIAQSPSQLEISFYEFYIKFRMLLYAPLIKTNNIMKRAKNGFNSLLGIIGGAIRKISPRIYKLLKRFF